MIEESKYFSHVVWDLTNLTKKARKAIFNHYTGATFNAVVFDFLGHEKTILERNQLRFKQQGKYIDEAVIKSMFLSYQPVDIKEGFNSIKMIEFS